jgi:hypothetical protein
MSLNCPKCDADISDSYEPDDPSVGIVGGWYCDACDLPIGEHEVERQHFDDDVPIPPIDRSRPLGTPLSELSGQPGPKDDIGHPDHARYAEFCRIAKSWGYD